MKKPHWVSALALLGFVPITYAATPINLRNQPSLSALTAAVSPVKFAVLSQATDENGTRHTRVQQTYQGVSVFGADAVIHEPAASLTGARQTRMNGIVYEGLQADLAGPAEAQGEKAALQQMTNAYLKNHPDAAITETAVERKIFVDEKNRAHWAYLVRFRAQAPHVLARPTALVDAHTLEVYLEWNDLKTEEATLSDVKGGGFGGNGNIGRLTYDGLFGHLSPLDFQRDDSARVCYLQNAETKVIDTRSQKVPQFKCDFPWPTHNNLYWNTTDDETNGGYSPNNDALYSRVIVDTMYKTWLNIPILVKNNQPMLVTMYVHDNSLGQNAYWENEAMHFGEGDDESYPVVAPSVVAHELSHGFTEQHANLTYTRQSGGLNEAYSDMADKAVEYFVYGKNNWEIDPELLKPGGRLLRWMDKPSTDCGGRKPGNQCSIDNANQYHAGLDVHFSSGVYNRAFTVLAGHWDTRKAFEVMADANRFYWTSNTTFDEAACGVIDAAKARGYDRASVEDAMKVVGVKTSQCT